MGRLYSIGEVLIDFIPLQKGQALKDVLSFERAPGGAPANVAGAVAKFGGQASMITKLGDDAFGDYLVDQLMKAGVETDKILRTSEANTALAFVSLREDGERDFSFYRKPSSDLLFLQEEIKEDWFSAGDILHFGSVDLVDSPMKNAHIKAIDQAVSKGSLISFDPNVRLPLWDNSGYCRETILDFVPKAHILKISDEELEFITGVSDQEEAVHSLFTGNVKVVVFTKGANGADLYLKNKKFNSKGYSVDVHDTTGAGDAFVGGILFKLLEYSATPENIEEIFEHRAQRILQFANASGALTTTGKGALSSLPSMGQIMDLINMQS